MFVHDRDTVERVLDLAASGLGRRRIAARTGLSEGTVREWLKGNLPHSVAGSRPGCEQCGAPRHRFGDLPDPYAYLLGLYLGDGCLSTHPRGVHKLRISCDAAYPGIVRECEAAISAVLPGNSVRQTVRGGSCVEVYAYSRAWPCLFPQHGPGKKHEREIKLAPWQLFLVELNPRLFLRGLFQSDGCRSDNTGRGGWRHPRYSFHNKSDDIRAICASACDLLGLRWTSTPEKIYVSRKADVARMDQFIGPKS